MRNLFSLTLLLASALFIFNSCEKDDHDHDHEGELITTLTYTLTDTAGNTVTLAFQDLDGDGGNAPTITTDTLMANMTYTGSLSLQNESESPVEDITAEIQTEAAEHQFFFESTVAGLSVAYGDTDANNNPIGLSTTLTTGAAGTGNLTIVLVHQPDKTASGVATGDRTNAAGETDIEVTFNVVVQ
jgi:hypothetical protein